ncbi:hypothetical protein FNQ90_05230 [Streptomyces alkaliphilus]|uniref:Uncharacterized protein n=1 Tax=Streptomyces alkaliphilus TaxID=1472722 RepID=A0A7W3TB06_9ACTN|nr:hypothetical protein [Streptomyces alkaliphilus]MBB0243524.1 hypothetical protein [Streptomyces alkaliphilus]
MRPTLFTRQEVQRLHNLMTSRNPSRALSVCRMALAANSVTINATSSTAG